MKQSLTVAALVAAQKGDAANFLVASTPGGIERQEAAGQVTFVGDSTLPKEMGFGCSRVLLEQMGILFGEDVDELFVNVKLPAGWKKRATEHSMHSELLDDKGRVRAGIFYKAAFYDRKAHISLIRRYNIDTYTACDKDGNNVEYKDATHFMTVVRDSGNSIHTVCCRAQDDYKLCDEHEKLARAWLNEHFPDWENPLAYWD